MTEQHPYYDRVTYIAWTDIRTAPDWVRVPTLEIGGYNFTGDDTEPQQFWGFTITQHPPTEPARPLAFQQPWDRPADRDQLRLNVFGEGWPALIHPMMTQLFTAMAVRQPSTLGEVIAILAELGAKDGTHTARGLQGLPTEGVA